MECGRPIDQKKVDLIEKEKSEGLVMKYFVLNPHSKNADDTHAFASRQAMKAYANVIKHIDPLLSNDLWKWVQKETLWKDDLQEDMDQKIDEPDTSIDAPPNVPWKET